MSRIGRKRIKLNSVDVKRDGNQVIVNGPKGKLTIPMELEFELKIDNDELEVINNSKRKDSNAKHGLYRSLINNMVIGVSEGFAKDLELVGVGYRVIKQGNDLVFSLGFSHQITISAVEGIDFTVEGQNKVKVSGIDKQLVGQLANNIRKLRPPCSYKGKGVKYSDEVIRKKQGKSVKK